MDGSVDYGSLSDELNLYDFFGSGEENNLNSPIPSPIDDGEVVDGEIVDGFNSSHSMRTDKVMNLSSDLESQDLNVTYELGNENLLNYDLFPPVSPPIHGEAVDDASSWDRFLESSHSLEEMLQDDIEPLPSIPFDNTSMDADAVETMHFVKPEAADEIEVQSELKATEVDEPSDAEIALLLSQLRRHESETKLQRKVQKSEVKRRKAHYKGNKVKAI